MRFPNQMQKCAIIFRMQENTSTHPSELFTETAGILSCVSLQDRSMTEDWHQNSPGTLGSQRSQSGHSLRPPTMEALCRQFIRKYGSSRSKFSAQELTESLGASLRRVYDMVNILEGCSILVRLDTHSYEWGRDQKTQQPSEKLRVLQNTSLRSISWAIFGLFNSHLHGLTCQELFCEISKLRGDRNQKAATLKRRIYECCKVLSAFNRIKKIGKSYYNSQVTRQQIIEFQKAKALNRTRAKSNRSSQIASSNGFLSSSLEEQELVEMVVERVNSPQGLEQVIARIRAHFELKHKSLREEAVTPVPESIESAQNQVPFNGPQSKNQFGNVALMNKTGNFSIVKNYIIQSKGSQQI